jgi:phenylacetate-CoA ligase
MRTIIGVVDAQHVVVQRAGLPIRLAQRAAIMAAYLTQPEFRIGRDWIRRGFRLQRAEYEQRSLARLAAQLVRYRAVGLCAEPQFDAAASLRSFAELPALPVLTRDAMQASYPRLVAAYHNDPTLLSRSTSGSTGRPTTYLYHPELQRYNWGMQQEMLRLAGWRPGLPRICLWGRGPSSSEAWKPGLIAQLKLVFDVSTYGPGPAEFERFLALIAANAPCAVYGYSSLLAECAQWMLDTGQRAPQGAVVAAWGGAESLLPRMRKVFTQAFGLPPRDYYGSREMGGIAAECEHGTLHINPRYIIEIADPQTYKVLPEGASGVVLITDLFNRITPFVRYELCDIGTLRWVDCPCGRSGYALGELSGRLTEQIVLPSGRRMNSMVIGEFMMNSHAVRRFLTVRLSRELFEFRYVGEELSPQEHDAFLAHFEREMEGAKVQLKRVDHIETTTGGKLIRYLDLTREAQPPAQ